MSKKWSFKDLKDKGIFVNQEGVGKKLNTTPSKRPSEEDIKNVLDKLKKKYDKDRL